MTTSHLRKEDFVDADFLRCAFPPPVDVARSERIGPKRFFNRELSWLAFNWRVLEEAQNPNVPLLERVRFVAISATNLDEFCTVRVAGLLELAAAGDQPAAADGLLPSEQLAAIGTDVRKLLTAQQTVWNDLKSQLDREGISLLNRSNLTKRDQQFLDDVFIESVFPVLTPLAIDPAHPFPFIPNEGRALALSLENVQSGRTLQALMPIPDQINRFIRLHNKGKQIRFTPLEELLVEKIGFVFPGYRVVEECAFRILRDSDLELEEEAEDLVREFEIALKRRRRGDVIHLSMTGNEYGNLPDLIKKELKIDDNDVFPLQGMVGLGDLNELVLRNRPDLLWPKFSPRVPERVRDHDGDMFSAIRRKDMLLHHPYETFDMVIRFLRQAANDPQVVAIKQTLYRTSYDSPIVEALCAAAENGKSVTALVELKARFDEAANIRQSRRLERAGAQVVYGFLDLKTHAKVSTVVRREDDRLVTYTHYGTGNYHPITARIYTDLSLFTCSASAGRDATKLINYVSGYAQPASLEQLAVAPINLRKTLLNAIRRETKLARDQQTGEIWAKMNSLIDPEVIQALYEASGAGVKTTLIVRGICGLRPGIRHLSENIRVKSVIGRFLEHSRIVCFGNGKMLPSKHARVFISSADWMERNLDRRVETLVEIDNPTVREQVMSQIMAANLADQAQSWLLYHDGTYKRHSGPKSERRFNCHRFFLENPSLSGRGSAGATDVTKLAHSHD
ncbi:MAG: RNA degradosome polyphosphate kinase [Rhodobacteraceae bacterium]|nr:RNA degradosome polyphosphate kinase [Paracoccaceae bacterium]MCY4195716.1 RNA degradosome polyphosphate kinase [Paracoccaceae bacterium]